MQVGLHYGVSQWTKDDEKLMRYVLKENFAKVRGLLKRNIFPTKVNPITGNTSLHCSVDKGSLILTKILTQDPGVDVNCKDASGKSVLYHAIDRGHLEIAEYLIERGSSFTNEVQNGNSLLHKAVTKGDLDRVLMLLEGNCPVNIIDKSGYTPLINASGRGQATISRILVSKGADVNKKSRSGVTPLMMSSMAGHAHLCTFLLNKGADTNILDNSGHDAMWHAITNERHDVVKVLEESISADINESKAINTDNSSPAVSQERPQGSVAEGVSYDAQLPDQSERNKKSSESADINKEHIQYKMADTNLLEIKNYRKLKELVEFDDAEDLIRKLEKTLESFHVLESEKNVLNLKLKKVNDEASEYEEILKRLNEKVAEMEFLLNDKNRLEEENRQLIDFINNKDVLVSDQSIQTDEDDEKNELRSTIDILQSGCRDMSNDKTNLMWKLYEFMKSLGEERAESQKKMKDLESSLGCNQSWTSSNSLDKLQEQIDNVDALLKEQTKNLIDKERELEQLMKLLFDFGFISEESEDFINEVSSLEKDVINSRNNNLNILLNGSRHISSEMDSEIKQLREDNFEKGRIIDQIREKIVCLEQDLEKKSKTDTKPEDIYELNEEQIKSIELNISRNDNNINNYFEDFKDSSGIKKNYKFIEFNDVPKIKRKLFVAYLGDKNKVSDDIMFSSHDTTNHDDICGHHFNHTNDEIVLLRETNRALSIQIVDLEYKLYERSRQVGMGVSVEAIECKKALDRNMKEHNDVVSEFKNQINDLISETKRLKNERKESEDENDKLKAELQNLKDIFESHNFHNASGELTEKLRSENKKLKSFLEMLTKIAINSSGRLENKSNKEKETNTQTSTENLTMISRAEYQDDISRLIDKLNMTEIQCKDTISQLKGYLLSSIQGNLDPDVKTALIEIL